MRSSWISQIDRRSVDNRRHGFVFPGLGRMFTLRRFPEPGWQFWGLWQLRARAALRGQPRELSPHSSVRQLFPRLAFGVILEFVVVASVDAKTVLLRAFGIASDELLLVVIEIEIKGIARIHIDHNEVGIVHGEFAEAQFATAESHVIAGLLDGEIRRPGFAEDLNNVVAPKTN